MTLFLENGKKWSKLAKTIEGRNENAIKNRFSLMFKGKKDTSLSHSDLIKVVRRKARKLEKELGMILESSGSSQGQTEGSDIDP